MNCALLILALALQEAPPVAVPDAAAQKKAESVIREVFKAEYARTTREDRLVFAEKLFVQSRETQDGLAYKYVLLCESRDVAAAAGDADLAYRAITVLSMRFTIAALTMKFNVLQSVRKTARTPEDFKELTGYFLKLADEALEEDDFDIAAQAAASAMSQAKNQKDVALGVKANAKSKEVAALKEKYEKVKAARTKLAAQPDNAEANGIVGEYVCIVKSDWAKGLPFLAKTNDGALKALAEKEVSLPGGPAEQVALGDAWWDRAEKESGRVRESLKCRAVFWYEHAFGRLTGLLRSRVEKRIFELFPGRPPGNWLDINDPPLFGLEGRFGDYFQILAQDQDPVVPTLSKLPDGDFDGISARIRFGPCRTAMGGLAFEDHHWYVFINPGKDLVRSSHLESGTWQFGPAVPCAKSEEYLLSVVTVKGESVVYVNGEEKLKLKGGPALFRDIGLAGAFGTVLIDRVHLRRKE